MIEVIGSTVKSYRSIRNY